MYKLLIIACFIAVACAKPSVLEHHGLRTVSVHSEVPIVKTKLIQEPYTIPVQEHTIERVGEHVETIPTAVSHQSSTILHSSADKVTPILAPAVRTHYQPAVRTIEKKFIEKVPVVESYVEPTLVKSYAAPTIVKSYVEPTLLKSYAAPTLIKSYGAPTVLKSYSAPGLLRSYDSLAHSGYYRSELPVISQW